MSRIHRRRSHGRSPVAALAAWVASGASTSHAANEILSVSSMAGRAAVLAPRFSDGAGKTTTLAGRVLDLQRLAHFREELVHLEGLEEDGLQAFLAGADDAVVGVVAETGHEDHG